MNAILTSVLKHLDAGPIYGAIQNYVQDGSFKQKHIKLGLRDNGVGLASLRLAPFSPEEQQVWDRLTAPFLQGISAETDER
ncbi:hypothetical protein [Paenibacillus hamazuiensis]|uniref:hypothetical protein n=1 Tax=Paenibacillus hamazuiensis TaxID=2936508 RepID=UPI00200D6461|nr:hypothetical protein [Paenibacillus hamazuiensis]